VQTLTRAQTSSSHAIAKLSQLKKKKAEKYQKYQKKANWRSWNRVHGITRFVPRHVDTVVSKRARGVMRACVLYRLVVLGNRQRDPAYKLVVFQYL
jgi:hypothetical protein